MATRPEYRRRGLFHALMARALAEADARFECLLLYTETPELYRPFGFRALEQRAFLGRVAGCRDAACAPRPRRLSLTEPSDLALLQELFDGRCPVSGHLGLQDHRASFLLTAPCYPDWRLDHLVGEEAVVVHERRDGRVRLIDVVCRRFPGTAALAAVLDPEAKNREFEVLFPPDRLGDRFEERRYRHPEGDVLMVRGPFAIEGSAFMLPPTAAF